ncbi:MAG: hypothetical protein PHY90_01775 [Desulfitobacteriaceae bacterium]|nr:hypothetical protein [Desulfitobacteriaceae bacterium]
MSELLGISEGLAMLIVWAVYTSFTFYGGSRGVIITDTIMFFIFMLVLLSLPVWADPVVIGLVCGLIAIWIGSSVTKVTDEEKAYRENLFKRVPMDEYTDVQEVKKTLMFPKVTIGVSLVVILLMIFAYAIPYARLLH